MTDKVKRFKDAIFFLIVFSLIFNNIPKSVQMMFLGGCVGDKLVFYPLVVGMFYSVYIQIKHKSLFTNKKIIIRFILLYISMVVGSLVLGLVNYPFYEVLTNGPINQIDKLTNVLNVLEECNIKVVEKYIMIAWMILRNLKGLFLEILFTFGGAYMIYCWYADDYKRGIKILCLGVFSSVVVIVFYSVIEIFYLAGNKTAKDILQYITPFFHFIGQDGYWWPPLLWKGQLRSLFAEPSYFGTYCAFAVPFLYLLIFNSSSFKRYFYFIFTIVLLFFLVLTKARTGIVLHMGQLLILISLLIYLNKEKSKKIVSIVLVSSLFAFCMGNLFISTFMNQNNVNSQQLHKTINQYVDNNIASLGRSKARSNHARYSIMLADFKIGLDYPVFGVGNNLRNAYIPQYLSEEAKNNEEIKMWLSFREKFGILKYGFPRLGEYTVRFAETGIIGLILFLSPVLYLLFSLIRGIKKYNENLSLIFYITALVGIMANGLGNSLLSSYYYWVLLGLGYTMIDSIEE